VNQEPAWVDVRVSISASSAGWVSVAWNDSFDTIGLSESRDFGFSFLPVVTLQGSGDRDYATIAIDEKHSVYLAWTDERHSGKGDIYLSRGVLDPPAGTGDVVSDGLSTENLITVMPNPFSSHVTIELAGEFRSTVVHVYDVRGRLVRRLHGEKGSVHWNARDEWGVRVSPGVYHACPSGGPAGLQSKLILCD
jgi:hypothetical protein